MGTSADVPLSTQPARRGARRRSMRPPSPRRAFTSTMRSLEALAVSGAKVSVHVRDLDRNTVELTGDDYVSYPIGGLGVVALLAETAAQLDAGTLAADAPLQRGADAALLGGAWNRLQVPALSVHDAATLVAECGDPVAVNALIATVGLNAVRARMDALGLGEIAMLDQHRPQRGPDDAPYLAVGTTRALARLFADIANAKLGTPAVGAQVGEWLAANADLTLVGATTGLDPFDREDDRHSVLFLNKTGRADGVRADAGVIAGPRAGVAYAITVCFDDLTIAHRLRVHEALRTFGTDLMEYVF